MTRGSSRQVAFLPMTTPDGATPRFDTIQSVREGLADVNYLADEGIAGVAYLADRLGKPVLVEGPAGTGKTQLAKSIAEMTDSRLIRLQCYEGLDESKALYEWNYKKQLLRIQTERGHQVVSSGPYRWMRHPGYSGALLTYLATPFFLDSRWGFLPAIFLAIVLVIRTSLEDKILQDELQDYSDYARRVHYRLLPGVW